MARIWHADVNIELLNAFNEQDMLSRLGFVYTDVSDDTLFAEFPIDVRTRQAFGLLHGGVSCAVSESMGSVGANLCVDRDRFAGVGIDLNASHLRGARDGIVTARCFAIRVGRRNHVWQTDLFDDHQRHLCVSRLTIAIVER